ncbi:MAG TPA: SurA N-terminal domain-containing protein [Vicinamibacterales bacterium]
MQSFRHFRTAFRSRLIAPAGLIVLALAASGCRSDSSSQPQNVSPDTWATVDGRTITRDEVEKAFRRTQEGTTEMSPEEAMTVKLSILNEMILQDILLARAQELKIDVPASELDAAFNERKQNLSDEQFQEELKKRSITVDDMREGLRRELITQKLLEQEVTSKVNVTEEEITEFFNQNREEFTVAEESYRLAQIVVTPDREPQPTNRTGNDATNAQEASFKVRMIMERLKSGTPFREVAMDYSEDPETAARGGDLGLVPVSALQKAPKPLRDAVIGKKPGTANVAQSNGIYTIVAVIAHEPPGERDLSTPGVRDIITQTLRGRKEQLLRTAYLSAARGEANVVNHAARRIVEAQGKVS